MYFIPFLPTLLHVCTYGFSVDPIVIVILEYFIVLRIILSKLFLLNI